MACESARLCEKVYADRSSELHPTPVTPLHAIADHCTTGACGGACRDRRWSCHKLRSRVEPPQHLRKPCGERSSLRTLLVALVSPQTTICLVRKAPEMIRPNLMNGARSISVCSRLTPKQVADLVGRTERTLWFWRKTSYGPKYIRIKKQIYYPVDEFNEWLRSCEWK